MRMIRTSAFVIGLSFLFLSSCVGEVNAQTSYDQFGFVNETLFNYASQGNDWPSTFPNCGGSEQSPIDISSIVGDCSAESVFYLELTESVNFTYLSTSSTIEAAGAFGQLYASDINGNLAGYNASFWKLHSPSEHTVQGVSYDGELQIYFEIMDIFEASASRTWAVVSFLLTTNSNTTTVASSVLEPLGLGGNTTTVTNMNFSSDITGAVPLSDYGDIVYYTYQGSLTEPNCNETVNWYVIDGALPISQSDLAYMNSLWLANSSFAGGHGNNRALQSVNGRTITQGGVACQEQFIAFFSFFVTYLFINFFIFRFM